MPSPKDFNQLAKERFQELEMLEDEIQLKLAEIQKQKSPLKAFLQGAGLIEVKKRGRRGKKVAGMVE
jgi:hypothetical protein